MTPTLRRMMTIASSVAALLLVFVVVSQMITQAKPHSATTSTTQPTQAEQVWGKQYAQSIALGSVKVPTLSAIQATREFPGFFIPTDIAPDGTFIVGYTLESQTATPISNSPAVEYTVSIDVMALPSGSIQHIAQITTGQPVNQTYVATDGRYVIWNTLVPINNGTGSTYQLELSEYDRQTQQASSLNEVIGPLEGLNSAFISLAGHFFLAEQGVLYYLVYQYDIQGPTFGTRAIFDLRSFNLSTHAINTVIHDFVPIATGNNLFTSNLAEQHFSWPYLLYNHSDQSYHLHNLQTGADSIIPVDDTNDYHTPFTIQGTTISIMRFTEVEQGSISHAFLRLPHVDQPGAQWQVSGEIPYTNTAKIYIGADARLFFLMLPGSQVLNTFAQLEGWDSISKQTVILAPALLTDAGFGVIERGSLIAWENIDASGNITLFVMNTATLRK